MRPPHRPIRAATIREHFCNMPSCLLCHLCCVAVLVDSGTHRHVHQSVHVIPILVSFPLAILSSRQERIPTGHADSLLHPLFRLYPRQEGAWGGRICDMRWGYSRTSKILMLGRDLSCVYRLDDV